MMEASASEPPTMEQSQPSTTEPSEPSEPSMMEQLPDELLVAILSKVRPVHLLLECIPLVCKRWHRLSPDCWAGVPGLRVTVPYNVNKAGNAFRVRVESVRLLLQAPPAARLHLHLQRIFPRPIGTSRFVSLEQVLRRCAASIPVLSVGERVPPPDCERLYEKLLKMMAAHGKRLQTVHLRTVVVDMDPDEVAGLPEAPAESLAEELSRLTALRRLRCPAIYLSVASAMSALSSLELHGFALSSRPPGPWPAAGSMPALRRLAFQLGCYGDADQRAADWTADLVLALARAAPGVTHLSLACDDDDTCEKCLCCDKEQLLDALGDAMDELPRLQRLKFHAGRDGPLLLLDEELQLPELAELDLLVMLDGADDIETTHRDAMQVKKRWPGVAVRLAVHMLNPDTMFFSWGPRQRSRSPSP